jgi:hypothetical protein
LEQIEVRVQADAYLISWKSTTIPVRFLFSNLNKITLIIVRYTMEAGTSFEESLVKDPYDKDDFSSPWHFSDVVLVVEDSNFHVHKCILSMWSPVFQTMFTSKFLESAAKEITLPGKRKDEMEELLKLVYSSEAKELVTGG